MQTLFIESQYDIKAKLPAAALKKLPEKIGLFGTVQYMKTLEVIEKQLKKPVRFIGKHGKYKGQVLGCNIVKYKGVDAILYVGDGRFHPIALGMENDVPIYTFNPNSKMFKQLEKAVIDKYRKRREAGLKKFLMSERIGILVSTKYGQNQLNIAKKLKKKLDKECYILISDTIDLQSLENLPFIDCFVNTACPRIALDDHLPKPVVDINYLISSKAVRI